MSPRTAGQETMEQQHTKATATQLLGKRPVAAYIWCDPCDTSLSEEYRWELGRFADRIGLPEPSLFEDRAPRAQATPPALECLLALVAADIFQAVLVPRPFVLAPSGTPTADFVGMIAAAATDCRIIELAPTP